jgi:nucleoside-diphosphate-sugar epimerase
MKMKILVTGGAGYVGSVLVPKLLARGHQVRVLDIGYFGIGHLRLFRPTVELVRDDLRHVVSKPELLRELLNGCDAVIHLAAISNDPSAELNPELTEEVNLTSTVRLAEAAREKRLRFLFSSSCSVYGQAPGEVDEDGSVDPLTVYAVSKVKAERRLAELADRNWKPLTLRNGTLFGYSTRMRFDLVVNIFSLYSALNNQIQVFGGGQHWRPFLHVGDCARAFVYFVERDEPGDLCCNIAHQNLRVVDVAEIMKEVNPRLSVVFTETPDQDRRDYRVSTARMRAAGFETRVGVAAGAAEMVEAIVSGVIQDPESVFYRNAKWLSELSHIGSKEHRDLVSLIETLAHLRLPRQP